MWTILTQPGVMTSVVYVTAAFSPLLWGLIGAVVLPAAALVGMAVREYGAQPPLLLQEPVAEDIKLAA
jgi:hypothetical protein